MVDKRAEQAFGKKGFEIAYAIFRLAEGLNEAIKTTLYNHALAILEASSPVNPEVISGEYGKIYNLLRILSDSGLIRQAHAEVIVAELGSLNSAIDGLYIGNKDSAIDLQKIFTPMPRQFSGLQASEKDKSPAKNSEPVVAGKETGTHSAGQSGEQRKEAILNKVRQSGTCRLKDIQDALSGISDRTLRYDIQGLIERGELERIGEGGPATYYRLKTGLSAGPAAPIQMPPSGPVFGV